MVCFVDERRYWLNGCHRGLLSDDSDLSCVADPPSGGFGAECLSVYYPRLLRDGWTLAEPINRAGWIDRFEKPLAHGWTLVKLAHRSANPPPGRGCYWDEHLLLHAASETILAYPDWEWAESDPAGIIYAEQGCLFRRPITIDGPGAPALLASEKWIRPSRHACASGSRSQGSLGSGPPTACLTCLVCLEAMCAYASSELPAELLLRTAREKTPFCLGLPSLAVMEGEQVDVLPFG